jgi:glycosyltransferase involved in cell wall biosynthesis
MKTTLIILTLDEISGAENLFDKIPFQTADECIVIDGGSRDGTIEFFRRKGLKVIVQDKKGRGEAFKTAFEVASGEGLVFFSPDGNEDPADIPRLIKLLETSDMAIASRFMKGARNEEDGLLFPWRSWVNRAFTLLANIFWNRNKFITDTINGFRAIRKDAFGRLAPDASGFSIEYQMTIRAMKLRLEVKEIPTRESSRIGGASHAKSVPTGIEFLRLFIRECLKP